MKIICAWCTRTIKERDDEDDDSPPSHGMCPRCFEKAMNVAHEDRDNHHAVHGGSD